MFAAMFYHGLLLKRGDLRDQRDMANTNQKGLAIQESRLEDTAMSNVEGSKEMMTKTDVTFANKKVILLENAQKAFLEK